MPTIHLSRFERQILDLAYEVAAEGQSPNADRLFRRAWKVNTYAAYQDVKMARLRLLDLGLLPAAVTRGAVTHVDR